MLEPFETLNLRDGSRRDRFFVRVSTHVLNTRDSDSAHLLINLFR